MCWSFVDSVGTYLILEILLREYVTVSYVVTVTSAAVVSVNATCSLVILLLLFVC